MMYLLGFACPPPTGAHPAVVVPIFYDGIEVEAHAAYKGLLDLEPVLNHTSSHLYNFLNSMTNPMADYGERKSSKGITYPLPLRPEFARQMFKEYGKSVARVPNAIKTVVVHEFTSMAKIAEVPQDATAFANPGSYQNGMALLGWADPANDETVRQWGRELNVRYEAETEIYRKEGDGVAIYANYQESGDEKINDVFGRNYLQLPKLKAQYDPRTSLIRCIPSSPPPDWAPDIITVL